MKLDENNWIKAVKHPLGLVGYSLFILATVTLNISDQELVSYLLFGGGIISIIGGIIVAIKDTNTKKPINNTLTITENEDTIVSKNKIKTTTEIKKNRDTKIQDNEIG